MRINRPIFVLVILVISLLQIGFAEVEFHGFFRSHSAFRTAEPNDAMLLRNRMRLNSELWGDNVYGFASVDFLNDIVISNDTKLDLREAYLDIYGSWVDFRIGKQQVVWGKADGYFINDIVNPLDLSLFLLQDFEDIRMATTMVSTKLHYGNHSLELLVIPEFKAMNINFSGNWAFNRPDSIAILNPVSSIANQMVTIPIVYCEDNIPVSSVKNFEYGLKFNTFLLGTDLSFIYLKAREDKPIMKKEMIFTPTSSGSEMSMNLTPTYPWFTFCGVNFSRPLGMFVFRGEGGYYPKRFYDTMDQSTMPDGFLIEKPFVQGMIGVDYQLTGEINIAVQGIQEQILDYEDSMKFNDEINRLGSLMVNASLFNETVMPMGLLLYNFTNESYLTRISLDWKYSDSFTIALGADFLGGGSEVNSPGQFDFGQFDKNDNIYLKLIYQF